jgi:hypothetical protein
VATTVVTAMPCTISLRGAEVDPQARLRAQAPRHPDVDECGRPVEESVEEPGGTMADHRVGADGQRRGEKASAVRQRRVADREDAAMDAKQAPDAHAMLDRLARHPEAEQLPQRHQAVLPPCDRGDRLVHCSTF